MKQVMLLRNADTKSGNVVIYSKAVVVFKSLSLFLKLKMCTVTHPVRKLEVSGYIHTSFALCSLCEVPMVNIIYAFS